MARIIFFGTPDYTIPILEALKVAGHHILAVVTQPAKPTGRNQIITPSPTEVWAKQNNVQVLTDHPGELSGSLKGLNPDLAVVASYGRIIPNEVLEVFPQGMLNIHPSLLPKYRGACPIQNAILEGKKTTGVTIILMDEKMDHGPIIAQQELDIANNDTFESLLQKGFQLGSEMLVNVLPDYIEGKIELKPQDDNSATYTWKTAETKEAAYFDLDYPPTSEALDHMARAFYPWPNAWTRWNEKIIKLYPNRMIQLEGKKPVSYKQFIEGYPDFPLRLA